MIYQYSGHLIISLIYSPPPLILAFPVLRPYYHNSQFQFQFLKLSVLLHQCNTYLLFPRSYWWVMRSIWTVPIYITRISTADDLDESI